VLPASVIRRIRDLVEEAAAADADPDDVIDVLRTIWQTRSDPSVTADGEE